jgi:hypothetical protein
VSDRICKRTSWQDRGAAIGSEEQGGYPGALQGNAGGEKWRHCSAGDAEDFYHLTFDPAPANRVNALHSLRSAVPGSGRTVRTIMAYYDQPFYHDTHDAETHQATTAQLRLFVEQANGRVDRNVTAELEGKGLNQRLPTQDLAVLLKDLAGKRYREALTAVANLSGSIWTCGAGSPRLFACLRL